MKLTSEGEFKNTENKNQSMRKPDQKLLMAAAGGFVTFYGFSIIKDHGFILDNISLGGAVIAAIGLLIIYKSKDF